MNVDPVIEGSSCWWSSEAMTRDLAQHGRRSSMFVATISSGCSCCDFPSVMLQLGSTTRKTGRGRASLPAEVDNSSALFVCLHSCLSYKLPAERDKIGQPAKAGCVTQAFRVRARVTACDSCHRVKMFAAEARFLSSRHPLFSFRR